MSGHTTQPRRANAVSLSAPLRNAAERILGYLAETDPAPPSPVDAVIGFGMFDLTLPRYCADLYTHGVVRHLLFTGGIGAGTGDLGGPEADVWRDEVKRSHPDIPDDAFVIENRSTNTAENIRFTTDVLARRHPALAFGVGVNTAIVVASPSRLRRVRLTMRKLQPQVKVIRRLPPVTFDAELTLYTRHGVDYVSHLLGELDRLTTYPLRGWIAEEPLPADVAAAGDMLRSGYSPPGE